MKRTKANCNTIIRVKQTNTGPGPTHSNKSGVRAGITAANTQCVELPKACPLARKWLGKISEINTQITVPCPMACDAMNKNRKTGTAIPFHPRKKASATSDSDTIYPNEPIYINCRRPKRSINERPNSVNTKFVTPIPTLLNSAALASKPANSNIRGE